MLLIASAIHSRSPQRPIDPQMPELTFKWVDSNKTHTLRNAHLEEYPWFGTFDEKQFRGFLLPENHPLTFRYNPTQSINSTVLSAQIEQLLQEIKLMKHSYTDFTIIQKKDFNRKKASGLLVVKNKHAPFIVKLFIETPESFTNPWEKGFIPIYLFYMGGGVNRHLSGFTRLVNHQYVQNQLQTDPYWAQRVDIPRKWAWLPKGCPWVDITSKNIGKKPTCNIQIPGIYAIIADAIESHPAPAYTSPQKRKFAIELCNFLHLQVDPHLANFIIEKDTNKFVIVDTEHFPTMVGFKKEITFKNHVTYYKHLLGHCANNMIFCTKRQLRTQQYTSNVEYLAPSASVVRESPPAHQHSA